MDDGEFEREAPGTKRRKLLDRTFDISIILKGLDGLAEIAGGLLLLFVSSATLSNIAVSVTQHELSQDPHDFIASHLLHAADNLPNTQLFAAIYLLAHGIVKVVLVAALLKQKLWAYPATLVFLGAFIAYQLYRIASDATVGMTLLTIFDLFVVGLVWREYQLHRRRTPVTAEPQL